MNYSGPLTIFLCFLSVAVGAIGFTQTKTQGGGSATLWRVGFGIMLALAVWVTSTYLLWLLGVELKIGTIQDGKMAENWWLPPVTILWAWLFRFLPGRDGTSFTTPGGDKAIWFSPKEVEAHVERIGCTGKGRSAWPQENIEHTMTIGTTAKGMSAPKISINIWDDYYDDGYVPEGEIQKTYIYVEGSELPTESHKECLEFLLAQILACHNLGEASFQMGFYRSRDLYPNLDEMYQFERWEIKVENLPHKSREMLVDELEGKNLVFSGLSLSIYSES